MNELGGQVMLITGASRGIGAAIAQLAAAREARVVVNYRSGASEAAAVVEQIRSRGSTARSICADVSRPDDVKRMFREIKDELGGVDVLVNNAGILSSALITMTLEADFDAQMAVNAKGTFLCMQQAAKQMAHKKRGKIINCSSIIGRVGARGHVAYAASKAAVVGMSLAAAKELGPMGITVNVIAAGLIDTDMTAGVSPQVKQEIVSRIPLGRIGSPDDVARLVVFLAGTGGDYISGQVFGVDGGQVL
jgi:3-oxoacyl-[acyl-carrier protein] reductase